MPHPRKDSPTEKSRVNEFRIQPLKCVIQGRNHHWENHPLNRKINEKNALPKEEMRYEEFSHSTKG